MTGQNPGKTAAIILGGAAGVAFLVILLLFARSLKKKHDGMSLYVAIRNDGSFICCLVYTSRLLLIPYCDFLIY